MAKRTRYVVGFLLDPTLSKVVLIRKLRPEFQHGLLNGVGGHVEDGESPDAAMEREFFEETGMRVPGWVEFLHLLSPDADLTFFRAVGNVHAVTTATDEEVGVYGVPDVMDRCDTLPNIRWIIQMARTFHFGEHAERFETKEIMAG
jgi:8-oxo-dGTP diphosphatase